MALWGNKDSKTASGTIAIAGDGEVTGTSTAFTTETKIGNYIVVNGQHYQIVSITSDTAATVRAGVAGASLTSVSAGASYALTEKPAFVTTEAKPSSSIAGDPTVVFGVDTTEESQAAAKAQGVAHAGWVRRVTGTGGRSGRVMTEVLVAGGTITGDAADDTQFPDRTITIVSQPVDDESPTGESAVFTVEVLVSPTATPTYLWQVSTDDGENWASAAGTNNEATYTVADNTGLDGNQYRVLVSATGATTVTSTAATLIETA